AEFVGALDGGAEDRLGDAIEFAIGGIEDDHAPLREDPGIQTGEGRPERFAGTIGVPQKLSRLGIAEQFRRLLDERKDFVSQADGADWSPRTIVAGRGEHLRSALRSG